MFQQLLISLSVLQHVPTTVVRLSRSIYTKNIRCGTRRIVVFLESYDYYCFAGADDDADDDDDDDDDADELMHTCGQSFLDLCIHFTIRRSQDLFPSYSKCRSVGGSTLVCHSIDAKLVIKDRSIFQSFSFRLFFNQYLINI